MYRVDLETRIKAAWSVDLETRIKAAWSVDLEVVAAGGDRKLATLETLFGEDLKLSGDCECKWHHRGTPIGGCDCSHAKSQLVHCKR